MALPATPGTAPKAVAPASYGQPLPWHFHRVGQALNALGTLWIVALMVLINTDVLGRNLLGAPVRGVTELVSLSIVGIVFLQLADTLHSGRITRADVLAARAAAHRPVLAAALHAAVPPGRCGADGDDPVGGLAAAVGVDPHPRIRRRHRRLHRAGLAGAGDDADRAEPPRWSPSCCWRWPMCARAMAGRTA
jgi:hypothetical protein